MHVFLTGATGLVGGSLAGALLDAGHRVTALVRGERRRILDQDGMDRMGEITAVAGDVSAPDCGLIERPDAIDMVVHCAAITDFSASEDIHRAVNIDGTRHIIALAQQWDVPLVYVSTAYVCGTSHGIVKEVAADPGRAFTNGYEASKAEAEALVEAAKTQGLSAAIARPSIIVGRMKDGGIARTDDFYHLFRLFGSPLLGAVPANKDASFAIVPIDHVVNGLMAMVEDFPAFDGRIAHLVAQKPFAMADMLRIVGDYPGTAPARMVDPAEYDPAALDRRTAMVHKRIGAQFFEYFQLIPEFASDTVLTQAGIAAPHVDEAAFRRMIDHCIKVGFLDWT